MADINLIDISEVDFDNIKKSFNDFYKYQTNFTDYDFTASGLSYLLDGLAYNTHYNMSYLNFALNESFLDTAQLRSSVISLSKLLSYRPSSISSAKAFIQIIVNPNTQNSLSNSMILPKGTKFSSSNSDELGNVSKTQFITTKTYISEKSDSGEFVFNNVEIVEGVYKSSDYVVDKNIKNQKFLLENQNIDTKYLQVFVQEGTDANILTEYVQTDNIIDSETDKVFYVQESYNGLTEIYFGDNVISKDVKHGNIIRIIYLLSIGSNGNKLSNFQLITSNNEFYNNIIGDGSVDIVTLNESFDGNERETIDSIKLNSPKLYSSAGRAVSNSDYISILKSSNNDIKDVNLWDGKNGIYPYDQNGILYISINLNDGNLLTFERKNEIIQSLDEYSMPTISIEIVDANYIYIKTYTTLYLNEFKLNKDISSIEATVKNTILNYSDNNIERFKQVLEKSVLSRDIDNTDNIISSNITNFKIYGKIYPSLNVNKTYTVNLNNSINQGSINSNLFYWQGKIVYFSDSLDGKLILVENVGNNRIIVNDNIGTVDYKTGIVNISNINIQKVIKYNNYIDIIAEPENQNIESKKNSILRILNDDIVVTSKIINLSD